MRTRSGIGRIVCELPVPSGTEASSSINVASAAANFYICESGSEQFLGHYTMVRNPARSRRRGRWRRCLGPQPVAMVSGSAASGDGVWVCGPWRRCGGGPGGRAARHRVSAGAARSGAALAGSACESGARAADSGGAFDAFGRMPTSRSQDSDRSRRHACVFHAYLPF